MDATHICLEALTTPFADYLLRQRGRPKTEKPLEIRAGDLCPACGDGPLGFDGLLNLACPSCDYLLAGGFT